MLSNTKHGHIHSIQKHSLHTNIIKFKHQTKKYAYNLFPSNFVYTESVANIKAILMVAATSQNLHKKSQHYGW